MLTIPRNGYFAKELALRVLLGDKAFSNFKRFMDPCCGPIIADVPIYENDAAAIADGLEPGHLYKTTTDGITALNIVP